MTIFRDPLCVTCNGDSAYLLQGRIHSGGIGTCNQHLDPAASDQASPDQISNYANQHTFFSL